MSAVVLVAGAAPTSVRQHARHVAFRLTERGPVLVATSRAAGWNRMLPGDVAGSTVLGDGCAGQPIWTGGLPALLGLRRRRGLTILVCWPGASAGLLAVAAALARLRRERVVLDEQFGVPASSRAFPALLRLLADDRVVAESRPGAGDGSVRCVLAVCGGDVLFARTVVRAFAGVSDAVVDGWRLRVEASADVGNLMAKEEGLRHGDHVTFHVGQPMTADLSGADVVVVPHAEPWAVLASMAIRSGASAVVVDHPAAASVARRADGAWLTRLDPASILAAIERAGDAVPGAGADAPVGANRVRLSGERLLAVALRD